MNYRLIKNYPGCNQQLGDIISSQDETYYSAYSEFYEEVKEPQFKVGDWIYQIAYRFVDRICEVNNEGQILMDGHNDITNYWNPKKLRLATPQEIETHLIAEAKKRGFAKGVLHKWAHLNDIRITDSDEWRYNSEQDWLTVISSKMNFIIYHQGQWAEIVKEEPTKIGEYEVKFGNDGDSKFVSVGCKHYSYQEICGLYDACLIFGINQIYAHNHIVETNLIQKIHKELCR